MMMTSYRWISKLATSCAVAIAASANASPVVYTLRTVADGKLGNYVFGEALVTIQMKADTSTVQKHEGPNGGFLYENTVGTVTLSISAGGRTTVATFAPGEVYVRYDSETGIAGFGSPLSPNYPVALDCGNSAYPSKTTYVQDCRVADWQVGGGFAPDNGTLSALADPSGESPDSMFSPELLSLPQNLSQSTLLTGIAHSCATVYKAGTGDGFGGWGNLLECAGPASRGLKTDHGRFFLQDQIGGSNEGPAPLFWIGWQRANTGSLQVEVMTEDE